MLVVVMALSFLLLASGQPVRAQMASQETGTAPELSEPQNVGNQVCPVSGDKIDDKTKAAYEYQGKIYNFCCAMCIDEFKKNPGKYIKKVEEELQVQAEKK
jgi:YHS domain-containing protein